MLCHRYGGDCAQKACSAFGLWYTQKSQKSLQQHWNWLARLEKHTTSGSGPSQRVGKCFTSDTYNRWLPWTVHDTLVMQQHLGSITCTQTPNTRNSGGSIHTHMDPYEWLFQPRASANPDSQLFSTKTALSLQKSCTVKMSSNNLQLDRGESDSFQSNPKS